MKDLLFFVAKSEHECKSKDPLKKYCLNYPWYYNFQSGATDGQEDGRIRGHGVIQMAQQPAARTTGREERSYCW